MRLLVVALAALGVASPTEARAAPDPEVATGLATLGTVVPVGGLVYAGFGRTRAWRPILATSYAALLIAPSAGHFYAGDYLTTGMAVRVIGAGAVGLGFTAMDCDAGEHMYCLPPGLIPILLGTVTMIIGAGMDMASADDAATSAASTQARMFSVGGSF